MLDAILLFCALFFSQAQKNKAQKSKTSQAHFRYGSPQNQNKEIELLTINLKFMKRIGLLVIGIGMTSMAISQTASPELVSSGGDSFNNTSYQLDWSIGECITTTHSAGNYVLSQGFHQNSYVITSVEDLRSDIEMSVYPNPTTDFISLKVASSKVEGMQYTITDFSGKVLQTSNFVSDIEQINFSNYAVGTYFISVTENNQLIKSFKIIKN